MRRILAGIALFIMICFVALSFAGEEPITTGDLEFDENLKLLNNMAQSNLKGFCRDVSRYYGADAKTIDRLINKAGMAPADVYMAAKVRRLTLRSWDEVLRQYKENKGKGWGVIAKNLGIKPGSKEFHLLKEDDSGMIAVARGTKGNLRHEKVPKSKKGSAKTKQVKKK
jgi:hypothetical protein